jgi:hypothetical protein
MSELFEAEVKMEKQSTIVPLLLLLSLMAAVLGVVAYVVLEVRARQPLSTKEAASVVENIIKAQGPLSTSMPAWSCPAWTRSPGIRTIVCWRKREL